MTTPEKVTLKTVAHLLPFSQQAIYNGRCKNRWAWLSRVSPDGRKTRELWVDLPALARWAAERGLGLKINLEIK